MNLRTRPLIYERPETGNMQLRQNSRASAQPLARYVPITSDRRVTANLRRYQRTDTRRLYLKWLESCDLATPSFLREKTVEIEKSYRAPDGRRMQMHCSRILSGLEKDEISKLARGYRNLSAVKLSGQRN